MVFSCFFQIADACGNRSGEGESKQGQEGEENRWHRGEKGAASAGELGGSEQPRDAAQGTDGLLPPPSLSWAALWDCSWRTDPSCAPCSSAPTAFPSALLQAQLICTNCSGPGLRCWRPAGLDGGSRAASGSITHTRMKPPAPPTQHQHPMLTTSPVQPGCGACCYQNVVPGLWEPTGRALGSGEEPRPPPAEQH